MPKVTDEHRAARREQILDAAVRCVAREGFHRTTMAQVIAEADLSAGAVYGYFKGKPDLIKAIAGRALGGFSDILLAVADGPGPVSPATGLRAVVRAVERVSAETDGAFPKVALHAWSEAARDPEVREIVALNLAGLQDAWLAVLRRSDADGTLPAGDHAAMARVMIGLMPGFLVQSSLFGVVDADAYVGGFEALTSTRAD
jgi:AcrR family transcriptional regulator